jgi:hypothetical protein
MKSNPPLFLLNQLLDYKKEKETVQQLEERESLATT